MSYQARALQLSLLLHGAVIALVLIGSTFMGRYDKPVILDFDLYKPVPAPRKVVDLAPVKGQSASPAARERVRQNEPPRQPEESPRASTAPEIPPSVKLPEAPRLDSSPMGQEIPDEGKAVREGSPGVAGAAPRTGRGDGAGGKDTAGIRYINENYAYIRDKVLGNVRYPDEARRRDWQGKVILSFIIAADGSVKALRVVQGSGYKVLDRNAIETVRDSAPFPRPPEEAQIVIPVTYRLE